MAPVHMAGPGLCTLRNTGEVAVQQRLERAEPSPHGKIGGHG